jgi:hypothetical protein
MCHPTRCRNLLSWLQICAHVTIFMEWHWGQEQRHATAACITCMCIAINDLWNKKGVTIGQSFFTRQRRDKGWTKGRRGFPGAGNPFLPFVYSLPFLCLVKDDCRTVTWALFGLWLVAEHMCVTHSCSACFGLCPQCEVLRGTQPRSGLR